MKILFFSDLHGDARQAEMLVDCFSKEEADLAVGCGDFLYQGPGNPLSNHYEAQKSIDILNSLSNKVVGVRGNCDSEVDQKVLSFPMSSDYSIVITDNKKFFITHGHLYSMHRMPHFLKTGDIFFQGHTHIATISNINGIIACNPGSLSLPRSDIGPTYATYDQNILSVKLLATGETVLREQLC